MKGKRSFIKMHFMLLVITSIFLHILLNLKTVINFTIAMNMDSGNKMMTLLSSNKTASILNINYADERDR